MNAVIQYYLAFANKLHVATCCLCLILLIIVFVTQLTVVVLRYLFDVGFIELQDLVTYSFGMLCVLAIPTAVRTDKHVRVDVFRDNQSASKQRATDVFAIVVFLFPLFGLTLWFAWPLVSYSWSILEGSRETGGLPGFFIVLSALPLSCALILIQGLATIFNHHER